MPNRIIPLKEHNPDKYIKGLDNKNHIGFINELNKLYKTYNLNISYEYPEEPNSITIELTQRTPATLESKTIGHSAKVNKPYVVDKTLDIISNTETTYLNMMFDNQIIITCFSDNIINAEKIAAEVEAIFLKRIEYLKKFVDNPLYRGRLNPGFNVIYNDKKLYYIPLLITFRTSEIFYESNPIIRDIDITQHTIEKENNS